MTEDLISIVTPVYNGADTLRATVASVRAQTLGAWEHLVVDDGSQDESWELIRELASEDQRLRPIRSPRNQGVSSARNQALEAARGRYVAFIDADDGWLPEKLERQRAFMEREGAAFSFTDYRMLTDDGRLGRRVSGPARIGWWRHHCTRHIACLTVMIDRAAVTSLRFDGRADHLYCEDFLLWSSVIRSAGPARRCAHDLARYRVASGSRSSDGRRAASGVWRAYRELEGLGAPTSAALFTAYAVHAAYKRWRFAPGRT